MNLIIRSMYRAMLIEPDRSPYLLSADYDLDGTKSYQLLDGRTTINLVIRNQSFTCSWSTSLRPVYTIGSTEVEWI